MTDAVVRPDAVTTATTDRSVPVASLPTRPMPSLDGFRALAIGAVFATHWAVLEGGYIGVTLFFVLSGFLITTLLTSEQMRTGTIDLRAFYARRAARLLPSMVLVVALTAIVYLSGGLESRGTTVLAAITSLLYVTNWVGFVTDRFLGVLNVTWSLSQEEQYYLIAPAFLRRVRPLSEHSFRRTGWSLVATWALLVIARGALAAAYPEHLRALYMNPVVNMDGLLLGSGLCLLLYRRATRVPGWLCGTATSVVTLVVLLVLAAGLPFTTRGVAVGTAVASAGAAIILLNFALRPFGPLARAAENRVLVWIGQRSYTMYLVQLPVLLLAHRIAQGHPRTVSVALDGVAFVFVFAWAAASYPLERAIRSRVARRLGRPAHQDAAARAAERPVRPPGGAEVAVS